MNAAAICGGIFVKAENKMPKRKRSGAGNLPAPRTFPA